MLDNPKYKQLINNHHHFAGVEMDHDTKDILPVHLIIKLKTDQPPRIGQTGEPVAELTKFGWTPGKESVDLSNLLMAQTPKLTMRNYIV